MKKLTAFLFLFLFFTGPSSSAHERIVSFRPSITEILFALGLGSRVVGVTNFCHFPPEAEKIPKIGGYFNRSLEKVLILKPDLVVLVKDATTSKIASALQRASVETLIVRADSIEEIYNSIQAIADKVGLPERGQRLVEDLKRKMEKETLRVKGRKSKKVLLVIQRNPLITTGRGTFLDTLLKLAGAENIAATSGLPYPRFSREAILDRQPEVILDLDTADPLNYWSRYSSLPAVRNKAVHALSQDLFIPGPRIPEALSTLIEKIYP